MQPYHGFAEFKIIGGKREPHWTGHVELIESKLLEPLSWRKKALRFAQEHGRKPRVFVNSMSDLFHERLPYYCIDDVLDRISQCEWMTYLILTKRANRMYEYFDSTSNRSDYLSKAPWIWLGVSVEDQKRADDRIPYLRRTPAAVRFLSVEPMLEQIELSFPNPYQRIPGGYRGDRPELMVKPDWVIVGGESGAHARPFDLAWARSLRDQCRAAGVAFYMKQVGSKPEGTFFVKRNGHKWQRAVPLKDKKGGDPAEWPEDLRIQEVPGD